MNAKMKRTLILILLFTSTFLKGQNDGWHITINEKNEYTGIAIANGRIGMLTSPKPFQIKHTVLNNVYDVDPVLKVSQVVHGMDFGNLDIYVDGEKITEENITNWKQTMNMKEAAFTTFFDFKDKASFSCSIYALRNLQYTGYVDIKVSAKTEIDLKVIGKITTPEKYRKYFWYIYLASN